MENEKKNSMITAEPTLLDEIELTNKQTYCSIPLDTTENKKKVFAISENADGVVADHIDESILLKDLFLQKYEKIDEETGEVITRTRTILISADGTSYASASKGLYNSVLKLIALLGKPDEWDEPIEIKVKEVSIDKGKTYTITPVVK